MLLGPPVRWKLWRLSGHWIADPKVQAYVPEVLCNYWLENANTSDSLMVWDAFKGWLRGENIYRIAKSQKQSVQSLEELEKDLRSKEASYVVAPTSLNYGFWQSGQWNYIEQI